MKSDEKFRRICERLKLPTRCLRALAKRKHRFMMSVVQQRCWVRRTGMDAGRPVYVPAKITSSSSGKAMFTVINKAVPELAVETLKPLSAPSATTLLYYGVVADAVASNGMLPAVIAHTMEHALVDERKCALHQLNIATDKSIAPLDLINPAFCLHCSSQQHRNQEDLMLVLGRILRKMVIHRNEPPPPGHVEFLWGSEAKCGA